MKKTRGRKSRVRVPLRQLLASYQCARSGSSDVFPKTDPHQNKHFRILGKKVSYFAKFHSFSNLSPLDFHGPLNANLLTAMASKKVRESANNFLVRY
jgi:hypothetical protein